MGLFKKSGSTGVICDDPRILVIDDVASLEECAHVIELVEGRMHDARIVGEDKADVMMSKRSASVGWVHPRQTDTVAALSDRVAELAEQSARNIEDMQVVKYEPGDQHTLHLDTFDPDEPAGRSQLRNGGQRLRTGLLYLAEPSMGGSTAFPKVKARVKPKVGRLVLFDTVLDDGAPNPKSLHSGMPVVRGQKWACNFWFREKPPKSNVMGAGKKAKKNQRRR